MQAVFLRDISNLGTDHGIVKYKRIIRSIDDRRTIWFKNEGKIIASILE